MKHLLILVLLAAPGMAQITLKVRPQPDVSAETIEMPLEKYVAAVLAGEVGTVRKDEALKALAVAARTFAIYSRGRHAAEGFDLCGTTHCQRIDLANITPPFEAAARATAGELLWYQGKPALAFYSQDCGGATEDGTAPYLNHHQDPFCVRKGAVTWHWTANPLETFRALREAQLRGPRHLEHIAVSQRTASGRARELALSGDGETVRISASSFRFAIGRTLGWNTVRSDLYEIAGDGLTFRGWGAGHGVGLCQHGAEEMALEAHTYHEILSFYYPGTLVGLTGRGVPWTLLGGEAITLLTTHPDQDGSMLALAERQVREIRARTHLPLPVGVEIRVYPDLDTFRNATGEPGWVAAHTAGNSIHLQPAAALRARGLLESTLRHELLHLFVESQARGGLPVWFREGLVGYLERPGTSTAPMVLPAPPADTDLRQTQDAARARRAYAQATASVAAMVSRYGEGAVLNWLAGGFPRDVKNAIESAAATKSK